MITMSHKQSRGLLYICLALAAFVAIVCTCRGQTFTQVGSGGPSLKTISNIVYSSATLLKNGDVGLDSMFRWNSTWSYSNRPAFFWAIGDQNGFPSSGFWNAEAVRQGRPHEGGLGSGYSDVGSLRINTNGLVYQLPLSADPANICFSISPWYQVTNNAVITWDRIGSGTGITDTNHFCDTFKLFYLMEPNAGTFLLQTNINGGGWNTMRTINANNGTTNGFVTNLSLTLGYYAFRVQGSTGTNRIWDAAVYNSTAKNYVPYLASDAAGADFRTITNCQTNVWLTFVQGWNPDLMIFQDTGGAASCSAVPTIDPLLPNAATNADRIYIGWWAQTADLGLGNVLLQQFAITNAHNVGYFDVSQIINTGDVPDLATKQILETGGGNLHVLFPLGVNLLDQMLWNRVMRQATVTNGASIANIPMTGIVQPGTIVTNGMASAITLSNNVTARGTFNSYGPAASLVLQERGGSGVFFNVVPVTGNQLGIDYNGLGYYVNLITNGSTIAFSPADAFNKPMTLGDNAQGWKAIWMATPTGKAYWQHDSAEEQLTLSTGGTTTDTAANLLPANSIIEAVCTRVTTAITTATAFSVGDPTTATRFSASAAGLTANSTRVGIDHWSGAVTTLAAGPSQAAAAKVRITTTGTPGAGVVRITVFYKTFIAPGV